jgi:hypothetical protein
MQERLSFAYAEIFQSGNLITGLGGTFIVELVPVCLSVVVVQGGRDKSLGKAFSLSLATQFRALWFFGLFEFKLNVNVMLSASLPPCPSTPRPPTLQIISERAKEKS